MLALVKRPRYHIRKAQINSILASKRRHKPTNRIDIFLRELAAKPRGPPVQGQLCCEMHSMQVLTRGTCDTCVCVCVCVYVYVCVLCMCVCVVPNARVRLRRHKNPLEKAGTGVYCHVWPRCKRLWDAGFTPAVIKKVEGQLDMLGRRIRESLKDIRWVVRRSPDTFNSLQCFRHAHTEKARFNTAEK